ncbi:MAG: LysE family translocator [Rhizobiaceae bacterium]|nr:LysE family translocator [Rhizobiaceae bacterium]
MPLHDYLPSLAVAWTAYFIIVVSPGPATLALAATSMTSGRAAGLSLALGVYTGSFLWACLTSAGLAAILTAYAGMIAALKIVGGLYLLWLAWKSFRSATQADAVHLAGLADRRLTRRQLYFRGLAIHLTNPKAIFAWLSMISIGIPPGAPASIMAIFIGGCLLIGCASFAGLAILFSTGPVRRGYTRARRFIDGFVAVFFAAVGVKMLAMRL